MTVLACVEIGDETCGWLVYTPRNEAGRTCAQRRLLFSVSCQETTPENNTLNFNNFMHVLLMLYIDTKMNRCFIVVGICMYVRNRRLEQFKVLVTLDGVTE